MMMRQANISSELNDLIRGFDFSGGENCTYTHNYNLLEEDDIQRLDGDAADAGSLVRELSLSYDVSTKHYATVVGGAQVTDAAVVEWTFWLENE